MAVRAKDVAKELGISPATLSLVVNERPGISDTTRAKVLGLLKKKGYDYLINSEKSTEPAGGVAAFTDRKNSATIGFVTYRKGGELLGYNSFFPMIIQGMENQARKSGYKLAYISMDAENSGEEVRFITDTNCCGIVILATEMHYSDLAVFEDLGLPTVVLDNNFFLKDTCSVSVDNRQGTFLAMKYLKNLGHRRVGYLRSKVAINSFDERFVEAVAAASQLGMEDVNEYTYEIGYPVENAQNGMGKILERGLPLPTAFMADNDLVAVGAMRAVREFGLKVPEDISFVGFDDRPICTICDPPLTTVQISKEDFGAEAIALLIRILDNEASETPLNIKLAGQLVERSSTGPCRIKMA